MTTNVETRAAGQFEYRAAEDGKPPSIAGYAAVFDAVANIGDFFQERIARGAFDDVMSDDVVLQVDHGGQPLARTSSGTLKLTVDQRGLFVETELDPADPDVAALVPKMKRGDLSKMSFAFRVDSETWDETGDLPVRTINKIKRIRDVSVVTFPAYEETEIALRSLEESRASGGGSSQAARRMRMNLRLRA